MVGFGWAKKWRLQKRREFLRIQRFGTRYFGKYIVLISLKNSTNPGKAGITVSKKVGPAHCRNQIKRRIRHVLRTNPFIYVKKQIVIIAKDSASEASFDDLKNDLIKTSVKFDSQQPKHHFAS